MSVPVHFNEKLEALRPSATLAINEHCNQLKAQGQRIYKLGLGQSPFPVPDSIVNSLREFAAEKDYLPVQGLPELRQAVSDYHARRDKLSFNANNILIGPGSKELMFILQMVFDAELLLPTPCWVSYLPQANILGNRTQLLETRADNNWEVTAELLEEACLKRPETPKLLILNYPNNPTGGILNESNAIALTEVAKKYGVLILSDEIYGELTYQGEHASIASYYPEGTIVSAGLSKWCGAGGWRLGTFAFPESLSWLLKKMAAVASETYTSVSTPIQYAAVTAFKMNDEIEQYIEHSNRIVAALGDFAWQTFNAHKITTLQPGGGFYIFPDFSAYRAEFAKRGIHTAKDLCQQLLEETGVAIIPGHSFLRPEEELIARAALVDFNGAEALEASYAIDNKILDEDFLIKYCPNVVEAINNIVKWV